MSKGNSPLKVLRTAHGRIQKGWTPGTWSKKGDDGTFYVCLEGALFGYCNASKHGLTEAQVAAHDVVLQIIRERYGMGYGSIPSFNDAPGRTKEEVLEVIKLAIIRLETGESSTIVDEILEQDDFDNLLEFIEAQDK
jgi:hypothetical protein